MIRRNENNRSLVVDSAAVSSTTARWRPRRGIAIGITIVAITIGCNSPKTIAPPRPSQLYAEASEGLVNGCVSRVSLHGPETTQYGQKQRYRLRLSSDDANLAKIGDGSVRIEFIGATVFEEGVQTWIYPETLLEEKDKALGELTLETTVEVATALTPASAAIKRTMAILDVTRRQAPKFRDALAADYDREVKVSVVQVKWNADAVKGSSCLCVDVPVVFNGDIRAGLSASVSYSVIDERLKCPERAEFFLPWLSLASSQRRDLQTRAACLQATAVSQESLAAINAVQQVLKGSIRERATVVDALTDDGNVSDEVRVLCALLIAMVPDDEAYAQLARAARFDPSPFVKATCAFAASGLGGDKQETKSWTNYYRDHKQLETLQELFELLTDPAQRLAIAHAVSTFPDDAATEWLSSVVRDESLDPRQRSKILNHVSTDSTVRLDGERLELLANACKHVITYERKPLTGELRAECFGTIADFSEAHAVSLVEMLHTEGDVSDQSLALELLLGDGPRSAFKEQTQKLVRHLLSSPAADQQVLIGWASQHGGHRRQLLPCLFEELVCENHNSAEILKILQVVGLEAQAPVLLLDVARDNDTPINVRRDILNRLLHLAEPASQSPQDAFTLLQKLLDEGFLNCETGDCDELLGVPHGELKSEKLSQLLHSIAFGAGYRVRSRISALKSMYALNDDAKARARNSVDRWILESTPDNRRQLVEVVDRTKIRELVELVVETLERLESNTSNSLDQRLSSYQGLEVLASSRRAQDCLLASFEKASRREEVLANATLVDTIASQQLRARSAEILIGWMSNTTSSAELTATAYRAMKVLGEKPSAMQTLASRLDKSQSYEVHSLAAEFAEVKQDPEMLGLFGQHMMQGRRDAGSISRLALVCSVLILIVGVFRLRNAKRRRIVWRDYKTLCWGFYLRAVSTFVPLGFSMWCAQSTFGLSLDLMLHYAPITFGSTWASLLLGSACFLIFLGYVLIDLCSTSAQGTTEEQSETSWEIRAA